MTQLSPNTGEYDGAALAVARQYLVAVTWARRGW